MLNISDAMTAAAIRGYFQSGGHDYYIDGQNLPGIWGGKLAEEWGLAGQAVEKEPFERLAEGYHPLTGEDVVLRRSEARRAANDITMSAPKDFSLIYLAEKDEGRRQRLLQAFVESCDWIMGVMEQDAAVRVRIGGVDEDRKTGNWAYAGFVQFDSRPDEKTELPTIQIHRHHTVFNLSNDPQEQRVKALQIGLVKENADLWMPLFHNDLARRVRELGYGIRREKDTGIVGFAIAGVPRALVLRNSPRRLTILEAKERIAAQEGITDPERLRRLQAELGKLTRKHKQKNLSREELWNFMQRQLSRDDRAVLEKAKGQKGWMTSDADAAHYAMEHLFYHKSVVAEKKLLIEALRYGVGSVTLDGVKQEMQRQGLVVDNSGRATTSQLRGEEGFITRFTRNGKGKKRPVLQEPLAMQMLLGMAAAGKPAIRLTDEQEGAIRALVSSRDVVNVVDAGQGTGKTTLLEEYGKILSRHKVRATWLGTTHTAVDELKARGLPAMTLAHFLQSKDEQRKAVGTRLILDEASMLGHRDAYQLCRYAQEQGCRIDFVGDSKQYKSPVAGDPIGLLKRYGDITPITMTKTMRQAGRLKDAMEAIRDGEALKGHDILGELGFVHEIPLDQLTQKAAELYLRWSADGKDVPVISPTHAQANEIAAKIREGLRERGDLQGEDRVIRRLVPLHWSPAQVKDARANGVDEGVTLIGNAAYREETQALAVGDLVRTIMRGKTKDGKHEFKNGQKYAIAGFTKEDDPILNNGWVIDKDAGVLVQRYVRTGQGGQGITADPRAIVVYGTPSLVATGQEGFYVPVSRVREEVAVLTDSTTALRQAIQKQDIRQFATELFEGGEQQQPGLPERLKQHLGSLRRWLAFKQMRQPALPGPELTPPPLHQGYGL